MYLKVDGIDAETDVDQQERPARPRQTAMTDT